MDHAPPFQSHTRNCRIVQLFMGAFWEHTLLHTATQPGPAGQHSPSCSEADCPFHNARPLVQPRPGSACGFRWLRDARGRAIVSQLVALARTVSSGGPRPRIARRVRPYGFWAPAACVCHLLMPRTKHDRSMSWIPCVFGTRRRNAREGRSEDETARQRPLELHGRRLVFNVVAQTFPT